MKVNPTHIAPLVSFHQLALDLLGAIRWPPSMLFCARGQLQAFHLEAENGEAGLVPELTNPCGESPAQGIPISGPLRALQVSIWLPVVPPTPQPRTHVVS
ncbi:hypothetical protein [Sphingomonas sp.]|jgi:hypothetical protein|uniref:hypothetical protein n=1 Tax=Sphingomonas sp. TaxID=28214 RepID=UPI002618E465|nr:hypothetical protein [Sphingomonas sp.]